MATQSLPSTQVALVQSEYPGPLELKTVPVPEPLPGTAIVRVISTGVLSYSKQVFDGTRQYPRPIPSTPGTGAVGRIVALGPDSTSLKTGQLVFVDGVVHSRDDPSDIFLMGLHDGHTPGSKKLMHGSWRDGTWAEYCQVPLETVFPLNEDRLLSELGYSEADLSTLGRFLVVYGGLKDISLTAGETIIVAPATGGFGGGAVMVALAMGASIIAMGRNENALTGLANKFEGKVKTVKITGDVEKDVEELKKASRGSIDAVFDISPPMAAKSTHLKSCISAVKIGGRISLMGGLPGDMPIPLGLVMHKDLKLQGKWMYGRDEIIAIIKMVEGGILKIGQHAGMRKAGDYTFKDWREALDAASDNSGWDTFVAMRPE